MGVTVLVIDDHELIRAGVRQMLRGNEVEVVGDASTCEEGMQVALDFRPDVVLLDVRFPDEDSFEFLARLREKLPKTRVMVFTAYDNPTYMARAAALGAVDYVLKGVSKDELLDRVLQVARGTEARNNGLESITTRLRRPAAVSTKVGPLTSRETQILKHLAAGLSNIEISHSLGISPETVKEHVQNVLRKMDFVDRTQAAVWGVKNGLI